jgi:predicted KAP-like P-loop ATPase
MWNDNETSDDYLDFSSTAETVAALIHDSGSEPISIGVSGSWGTGKSSMVKMIGKALEASFDKPEQKYIFIEFNAWRYQGYDDAKSALMKVVSEKLIEYSEGSEGVLDKAKHLAQRVDWIQSTKLVTSTLLGLTTGELPLTLLSIAKTLGQGFDKLLKEESKESVPTQIDDLRKELEDILSQLNAKMVVLVDDLDRCLPDTAISTLEAMRSFLFVRNTAFIIAADEEMIRNGVRAHFSNMVLPDGLVTSYFDKLIQIPITVPHLGTAEVKIYLTLLFAEKAVRKKELSDEAFKNAATKLRILLRSSWKNDITQESLISCFKENLDEEMTKRINLATVISSILVSADGISGNPRLIKRFLNALEIRETVAALNGITVDYECLIKMLLFERCATPRAFESLAKSISESGSGKSKLISKYEKSIEESGEYQSDEECWNTAFVHEWLMLPPKLGNLDLRPFIFLAKDKNDGFSAYDELSSQAKSLLDSMDNLHDTINKELVYKLGDLAEAEAAKLLRHIARIGNNDQWKKETFNKALHVCQAHANLGEVFASDLCLMPPSAVRPDMIPLIKDYEWASSVLKHWTTTETNETVKTAINTMTKGD